ncbi:MAG TPA: ABC transporter permease [Vicinamibacterales bacterium]
MRKILTVAAAEFQTAVRSKGFLIGIAVMPFLILASIGVQRVAGNRIDREERRLAVIDRTERLYPLLAEAAEVWNRQQVGADGTITGPRYALEEAAADSEDLDAVRLALSERIERKELFAFLELPPALLTGTPAVRYYTNNPTYDPLPRWIEQVVGRLVMYERLRTSNVDPETMVSLMQRVEVTTMGLLRRDAEGRVLEAQSVDMVRTFVTPFVMMLLMFTTVISTASPLLNSVMEEKMTRISEVLLGSVSPFQLMMGKLLGVVGVSLLLAGIYLGGAYGVAVHYGYGDAVSVGQVLWFATYLVLAMLIYGSLFIAVGASANDLKDAQGLMAPLMIVFMVPMFVWLPVLRAPESGLAIAASLVPFATPVLMTLRLALEPKPATWQIVLSLVLTGLTTAALVWAAGRIFRVGILMQGKSASFGEMFRWVRAG